MMQREKAQSIQTYLMKVNITKHKTNAKKKKTNAPKHTNEQKNGGKNKKRYNLGRNGSLLGH